MSLTFILLLSLVAAAGLGNALYRMRNHPRGLYILFFAEMWERFSYYGMRAILIFYLTKHFLFTDSAAYGIYTAYTTLVYVAPIIGGVLADRYLGHRRAVMAGAVLLVLGHAGMAVEGPPVLAGNDPDPFVLDIFYLSLALIITGVGFLKGNISALVGQLYPEADVRRDSGFTLFYVGINAGACFGGLYAGYIGETFGWQYGFGLAGIGMLAGLAVFVAGRPLLKGAGEAPVPAVIKLRQFPAIPVYRLAYAAIPVMVIASWYLVRDQETVGVVLYAFMIMTYAYILWTSIVSLKHHERHRIFAVLILISMQVLFWALFEQAGSSLNVYTDRHVDRTIFGQVVPASVFQSLNAMYIILLGPLFAGMWTLLRRRGAEPSAPAKFGLGIVQLGLGFLVFAWGAASGDGLTPVVFVFLIYLLHTTGELCLSPVGLSAMTKLSTARLVGLVMGAWFLASAAGNFLAGRIAQATVGTGSGSRDQVIDIYTGAGWIAVAAGIVLIAVSAYISRLMHLEDSRSPGDRNGP